LAFIFKTAGAATALVGMSWKIATASTAFAGKQLKFRAGGVSICLNISVQCPQKENLQR